MPKYIVIDVDGTQVQLADWQDDVYDEQEDTVYRECTWCDDAVLHLRRIRCEFMGRPDRH